MAAQSRHIPMPPILLTRPVVQAERFASALRFRFGLSLRVVISPLLAPVFLAPKLPERRFEGLIFTSETGVTAYQRLPMTLGITAWCVGNETAEAARLAGFQTRSANGNAEGLAKFVDAAGVTGPLLHVRGEDTAGNLARRLTSAGIETAELIVYAQKPLHLSDEAIFLLSQGSPVIAPIFSSISAERLAVEVKEAELRPRLWIASISPAVAISAGAMHPARQTTAKSPNAKAVLDAISELVDLDTQP